MKLRLILSLLILSISFGSFAQDGSAEEGKPKKEKAEKAEKPAKEEKEPKEEKVKKPRPPFYDNKLPYIYVGGGNLSLLGDDIASGTNLYNTTNWKWGINGGIEHRTFSALGFSLNFLYGKLGETERSPVTSTVENLNLGNRNVQTEIMNIDFKVNVYLDNNLFINRASNWSPYLFGGVGYIFSAKSKADLKDADGNTYYYWEEGGRVMDRPFVQGEQGNAVALDIDNKYETELKESYDGSKLTNTGLAFPMGIGLRYKFGRKFHADISATYYWSLTDHLDAYKNGKQTDHFLYTSVGLAYNIAAKKQKPDSTQYDTFDFLSLDEADDDGDGVKNIEDLCANTPSGAVDASGCPVDSDKDGIPDYRDEETSADSAMVDANGITIDPDFIVLKDSNSVAHAIIYEAYPTMELARVGNYYSFDKPKVEEKSKELGDFTIVDQNGDGFISADEITWALDAFFEGELDFSAAKLHDLIDFFFDQ
ncbi:MAG: hypothetical protein K9G46_02950 [Flavobacteriales bacterium]|nr:hypothetical protein [Flavobacteriales bacterium]